MRIKKKCIDEQFISNEGCVFKIVEYNNSSDLVIEFQDEFKARVKTTYTHCQRGKVKNAYHKSICGVGYLGLLPDRTRPKTTINGKAKREYRLWAGMLTRCYSAKCHEKNPNYKDCTVCDRWHCFTNFLEDLPLIEGYELWLNNPNQGVALDKDLKGNGSKLYSLETCCFLTLEENSKEPVLRTKKLKPVIATNIKTEEEFIFGSTIEASRILNVSQPNISNCCNGKLKSTKGYTFRFVKHED